MEVAAGRGIGGKVLVIAVTCQVAVHGSVS